jgi:UDP-N-acetylenolpyruvoylglucosamine reductase
MEMTSNLTSFFAPAALTGLTAWAALPACAAACAMQNAEPITRHDANEREENVLRKLRMIESYDPFKRYDMAHGITARSIEQV